MPPLLAALLTLALPAPADVPAASVTAPLSLAQVHCEQDRLQALVDRTDIVFAGGGSVRTGAFAKPFGLVWARGGMTGDPTVFAYTGQWHDAGAFGPEKHLVADLLPDVSPLGRDPRTPLVPTFTLARDPLASDFDPTNETFGVTLNPVLAEHPPRGYALQVSDRAAEPAASTRRGRGLGEAAGACGFTASPADLHALRVLSRILRPVVWICCGSSSESPERATFAILTRGPEATPIARGVRTAFRLDAATPGAPQRRLAAEILVDIGLDGTLGAASMRLLPVCSAAGERDCTGPDLASDLTLQVIRPVAAGRSWDEASAPVVCLTPDWHFTPCGPGPLAIDFAERLEGTTWIRP